MTIFREFGPIRLERVAAIVCGLALVFGLVACDTPSTTIEPSAGPTSPSQTPSSSTSVGIVFTGEEFLKQLGAGEELVKVVEQRLSDFYLVEASRSGQVVTQIRFGEEVKYESGGSCSENPDGPADDAYEVAIYLDGGSEKLRIEVNASGKDQRLTRLFTHSDGETRGVLLFPVFVGEEALSQQEINAEVIFEMESSLAGYHQSESWCGDEAIISEFSFGSEVTKGKLGKAGKWIYYHYTVPIMLDGQSKSLYFDTVTFEKGEESLSEIGYLNPDGEQVVVDSFGD